MESRTLNQELGCRPCHPADHLGSGIVTPSTPLSKQDENYVIKQARTGNGTIEKVRNTGFRETDLSNC